jgi:hypothetical protein
MDALADDPEGRQGATVEAGEHGAGGLGADVEGLAAEPEMAAPGQRGSDALQRCGARGLPAEAGGEGDAGGVEM